MSGAAGEHPETHASTSGAGHHPLLRRRDGHHARVTFEELFFDLVYVFAVTQLSASLLANLSVEGALRTLVLWGAVWLGWQYTCWVTNWFDPEHPVIRRLVFATMLPALVLAAAILSAFGVGGLVFACAYVAIQVGRTIFIVWSLGPDHALSANYRRILGWLCISACFWIAGGFAEGGTRLALWLVAVGCEYVAPMLGFRLPGLGRSKTSDWTIEGGHLAERCQLFVIVALGETLLATGATLARAPAWDAVQTVGLVVTFIATLAMWRLYFATSSKRTTHAITSAADPGRMGANLHYVHAVLVAGVIVAAVGNDLVMAHARDPAKLYYLLPLLGGPALYLAGLALHRRVIGEPWPLGHCAGAVALLALLPFGSALGVLATGATAAAILLAIGEWDTRRTR